MSAFQPYPPSDFEAFWHETVREVNEASLDFERKPGNAFDLAGFTVETFTFRDVGGNSLHGWIAIPEGAAKRPAFLWTAPYGRESMLPNAYGTREGFVSLSFNFFGYDAFYQEKYTTSRGYFAEGSESPKTWVFRSMFQKAAMAVRVLAEQAEVDATKLAAVGMSQGAGISIWLGAWIAQIKAVCADMPFLAAMPETLNRNAYRYPLKELVDFAATLPSGKERVLETLSYFDTVNQAARCKVPTHVSLGLKDPAVRPETAEAVFEALPGRKLLRRYDVGHDWYPPMIENNKQWLVENL